MTTPVRSILLGASTLLAGVRDGLGALERPHKQLVDEKIRPSFDDSLDIDDGVRGGNEQENRWDYLLGHGESSVVVALEPHSAHTSEVSTVIAKKSSARRQLRAHLKPGSTIAAWFWVASGKVDFAPYEKVIRRLDQEGITFVGGMLRAKDMPKPSPNKPRRHGSA
jgi:hypothetical protein